VISEFAFIIVLVSGGCGCGLAVVFLSVRARVWESKQRARRGGFDGPVG